MNRIPLAAGPTAAQREQAIAQWRDLRVGLFIHWGPSSGRALPQSHSHARQNALNPHGSVPAEVYDQFYTEFNPTQYDPDAWLKLAHEAGMRYAVFVAKHHDGFCMFDSAATDYDIMASPYGKDVAAMFAAACRRQGLALGWQISPKDWRHPDFAAVGHDRYNAYYERLIDELSSKYGPLAVMWFDGIEPVGPDMWKDTPARVARMLHDRHPSIMLGTHSGAGEDFLSFENMVAPFDRELPWEMCEAINPSG
jgi:alpha-L-fucosidase